MARNSCWNEISENCVFILSEINEVQTSDFFEERKVRNAENITKKLMSLKQAVIELIEIYANLCDVNLHVFHAKENKTIIDIRYFLKSKLDLEYQQKVVDKESMLHCKIVIPPYQKNKEDKYDGNWESRSKRSTTDVLILNFSQTQAFYLPYSLVAILFGGGYMKSGKSNRV